MLQSSIITQGIPFYSVKFRNLVNSSNSSCRSVSDILLCRLGINDLASSALSQQRLPVVCQSVLAQISHDRQKERHTQLRSFKHLQLRV